MTTEIYRNTLFEDSKRLEGIRWVIFDEVHYLDDWERGTVWEEAIMFSPPHLELLCLIATVPNISEIASWIRDTSRVVRSLSFAQLVSTIYRQFPDMKVNSVFTG